MGYISATNTNTKNEGEVFDATVIANYGDPGLDEDYQFDLLSRYVICMIESSNRVVTTNQFQNMIVAVKRPYSLWVDYQGGMAASPNAQQRIDKQLNSNLGPASNYTTNNIPRINYPYNLGDKIKIKLIKNQQYHYILNGDTFFQSVAVYNTPGQTPNYWGSPSVAATEYYQSWHTQGLNSNVYITNGNAVPNFQYNLQQKTITPLGKGPQNNFNLPNGFYYPCLNKMQYEAFVLQLYPAQAPALVSLFQNQSNAGYYYNSNGGYVYKNLFTQNIFTVKYEDINGGLKARVGNNQCIPLVVTSPNSFVVPASRSTGTVNYNPSVITKAN